jgi:hypothetical protein
MRERVELYGERDRLMGRRKDRWVGSRYIDYETDLDRYGNRDKPKCYQEQKYILLY